MTKLNALLLTTICAALSPFAAGAAEPPARPLQMEELPAAAILRVNKPWNGVSLLPDGGELRLSEDRRSLEIRRLGQVRRVDLPGTAFSIGSRNRGLVQISGVYDQAAQGSETYFVHLQTGRVHAKRAADKAYVTFFGEGAVIVSASRYEYVDGRTGELKFLKERASANGISYSSQSTSLGQIVTMEGTAFLLGPDGDWGRLPVSGVSGLNYCSEDTERGVLECGGQSQRILLYPHGNAFVQYDATGKTLLAVNRAQHEVVWVKEFTDVDVKRVATLNLTRMDTGATRQIPFRTVDPRGVLDFFFRINGDRYMLWYRDKEVEIVPRDRFWAAFDARDLSGLRGQGRRLGRARSVEELGPLLQAEYAPYATHADGEWRIEVRDGVLSYGPANAANLTRIFLGADPHINVIPRTPFALLQFRVGSSSFNVLYNMERHRAFELGAGYITADASERGDQLLLSRSPDEWLVSLRLTNAEPNWRRGLTAGLTRGELGEDVLGSCTTPALPPAQGIAATLLGLRQMPGGRVDEHALKQLLAYELNQGELTLVAQIVQKWYAHRPDETMLAFRRLQLAERLQALRPGFKASPCLSTEERVSLRERIKQLFTEVADQNLVGTDIYSFQHLVALQPLVREFGYANEGSEDVVVSKIAKAAELHPQLQGVFPSKLYYFAKAVANPIFGRPMKFKTDVTVSQDKKTSHVTLLSSVPAYGQPVRRNSFGFYHGVVRSLEVQGDVGATHEARLEWRALGRKFAADVKLTKSGDLSHLTPPTASADYAALNRDGKLVGMMVVGTNMGNMHTTMTMNQYEAFYRQHGYKFDPPAQVPNSLQFMRETIASGELDYLVKEAHSDGDEKNLFRAARVGELRVGRRVHPHTGRTQIAYLLAPKYGTGGTMVAGAEGSVDELIPNQLFGEWVRAREAAGRGPLVYLNASCTSITKVVNEITATRSKLLIAIPSVTAITMFRNRDTNSTAVFLEGLHESLDWASIRKRMEIDPEVKEQRNNMFALPNEERFEKAIRQSLGFTVDTDVRLTDLHLGRSFSVDEFNRDH